MAHLVPPVEDSFPYFCWEAVRRETIRFSVMVNESGVLHGGTWIALQSNLQASNIARACLLDCLGVDRGRAQYSFEHESTSL